MFKSCRGLNFIVISNMEENSVIKPQGGCFTDEQLDSILEEIAGYEIDLAPDPTLPHLGFHYIQNKLSECRNYSNRVQGYLLRINTQKKNIRLEIKLLETDIDMKINNLLADNEIVRRQSSITDRKAVAISMLKEEYDALSERRNLLVNLEETAKIVKVKYDDLNRTNGDIKVQRQLIRDDRSMNPMGDTSDRNPDGTIPNGMPTQVKPRITAEDLMDPNKRPDDMPEPMNVGHAQQIATFLSSHPENHEEKSSPVVETIGYGDLLDS